MAKARVRSLAQQGGRMAHEMGVAHTFSSDEARAAGRKGGLATAALPGRMAELSRLSHSPSAEVREARELRRLRAILRRGYDARGFDTRPLWVRALETRRKS